MSKTWGEIKAEALQLMFSYSNGGAVATSGNEDYELAMPAAANYALRDLASVCRPIAHRYYISHNPVQNMLGDTASRFDVVQSAGSDIIYTTDNPKAFYFEVDRPCMVLLEQVVEGVPLAIQSYEHTASAGFVANKGLIALTGTIRLRFLGGHLYHIRNIAFYASSFASVADIPAFTRSDRYNLRQLIGDAFYRLPPNAVTVEGNGKYRRNDEFMLEDDGTLVIDHYAANQYAILYEAYPTKITADTADSFAPELPDEALDIVPLYIAGRLYMDDNASMATGWLNQYNMRRAEMSEDMQPVGRSEWNCETGWW